MARASKYLARTYSVRRDGGSVLNNSTSIFCVALSRSKIDM